MNPQDLLSFNEPMNLTYKRSPGKIIGRFLAALKNEAQLLAIRCSKCSMGFLPPQAYCPDCKFPMNFFFVAPKVGKIAYFASVHKQLPFEGWKPPFTYVGVKFEGIHTVFWHRMLEAKDIEVGLEVVPVFKDKEERQGSILDIDYFKRFTK